MYQSKFISKTVIRDDKTESLADLLNKAELRRLVIAFYRTQRNQGLLSAEEFQKKTMGVRMTSYYLEKGIQELKAVGGLA